jgi:TetR/AcrR family transcriptional regulator, mexJK operon transcriptional repressor
VGNHVISEPTLSKQKRSTIVKPKSSKPNPVRVKRKSKRPTSKPGPGRPTAARAEEINKAILAEAYKLFWDAGYPDTQMEAVAKAVGIAKQTLYDRYPNKMALLTAVLAEQTVIWAENSVSDARVSSTDLRTRLKQRARIAMEYCSSGEFDRSERFWRSCPPAKELRRMHYELGHKRTAEIIAREIIELSPGQTTKPASALQLAEMLMSSLYGWWVAHFGVREITPKEAHAYADRAVDVLFDGQSLWKTK